MTYAIANIHGDYDSFVKMLEKIKFSDDDVMFILGDIVDYGEKTAELLCDLSVRFNVYPIIGEHDAKAYKLLMGFDEMLKNGTTPDEDYVTEMTEWMQDGGKETLDAFRSLDDDMKEGILDYLAEFVPYETVNCGGKDYVLVHAGIEDFSPDKELDAYDESAFIGESIDMDKKYFENAILVVGHIPTEQLEGAIEGKIFRKGNNIAIDCGNVFGGQLGCLRLDDGKEFYV
ncbi:MAG: metallophosphoesterase [Clostridia bacterium]|nr:metallophosphoesterase [Clostridia bacterium]MBR2371231.1 metallophosphoesterase [Clostridia bacterium]